MLKSTCLKNWTVCLKSRTSRTHWLICQSLTLKRLIVVLFDFGQAVIGLEFLAETYAEMGDAYSSKVIEFENVWCCVSLQTTEALAVDVTEKEAEDLTPSLIKNSAWTCQRTLKTFVWRNEVSTWYPAIEGWPYALWRREERKAAKPRVKYIKQFRQNVRCVVSGLLMKRQRCLLIQR